MSSSLLGLATELQQAIIQQLDRTADQAALRSWSCTCSFYRSLIAPHLFQSIVLRNYEKNASSVQLLANSQYRGYVEELHYIAAGECTDDNEDSWKYWTGETRGKFGNPAAVTSPEKVFPDVVHTVLSDLTCFPHLKTLSIEFPVNFKRGDWSVYWAMFDEEETQDEVQTAEENEGWRALMAKTFDALSLNGKPSIKALEIRKLYPLEVSTFRSEAFHDFLGTLDRFDLSLFGGNNGAGWGINCPDGYLEFVSKLDAYFFDHLTNVTEFRLRADATGPLGDQHADAVLLWYQMPMLKSVFLENIFVGQELIQFLAGNSKTLESISLHDCFGFINGEAENGIFWEQLFTALADAEPEKLRQLEVFPLDPPYHDTNSFADLSEHSGIHLCRIALDEDPQRRPSAKTLRLQDSGR